MSESAAARLATSSPEEFTAHADAAIAAGRAGVARFIDCPASNEDLLDEFDELISGLDDVRRLAKAVSQFHPGAANRAAGESAEQAVDKLLTDISLDVRIYERLRAVDASGSDSATQHYLFRLLRDFRRAGVDRDEATRARVRQLREELVSVGQSFQRNINTGTRAVELPLSALDGLPADYVRAHPAGEDGLVRITTDYSDYIPFMSYATDARARESLWRQFNLRGYPQNIEVLKSLLALRRELAGLLGYGSYAQYVTEDKMIGSDGAAADFIERISAAAQDRMLRDYEMLLARKRVDDPSAEAVDPWDTAYLEDRVRAERFTFDSQAMRPYYEYSRVKQGLMTVTEQLFGVRFAARPDIPVWHESVDVYDVFDGDRLLGRIFLDMHPRADKFSHAAMFSLTVGKAGRRVPECVLLCNLPQPGDLLQHTEVNTFFHEFGHLIHHVLGGHQRWAALSGIKTEWDFAEAPSQLLEEWTNDAATLQRFALHHETGEPIPATLVEQMRAADEFGKGLHVRRQMFYASLSLELYRRDPDGLDPLQVEIEMRARHIPFAHIDGTYMHLSFGHLDGYSAIYYTYMWSLVIAKDLFTAFDPDDLLARGPASRYRTAVLAAGGSAPAAQLVRDFLGRDYTFDAFKAWLDRN
ncbi:M3 family metallopeptidase [Allorhizocola rhizosphaerae]|uniref:M3 family metallopeptidase n=1 Tax=Allorhizocola rhizosphaerae TaxID=1872709 RepID=UPI000E3E2C08|nr:M3 family metallopeptidase [Allorhizocola rhizosphaerae]